MCIGLGRDSMDNELKRVCGFMIEVLASDDFDKAQVTINCDIDTPPDMALLVMVEHLMTVVAMNSDAGFEEALKLLCEGARSNKVQLTQGKLIQ
jgi:hypothetical protein